MPYARVNASRLRQNGCHFAEVIFKFIFLYQNCSILIQILLIVNKPLSETMMVKFIDAYASLGLNELINFLHCYDTCGCIVVCVCMCKISIKMLLKILCLNCAILLINRISKILSKKL